MSDLPRLTTEQQALVQTWLPEYELVADLSWEQMDTAALHLRTAEGDRIVKAGGAENHHIGREIAAHLGFTGPWVKEGRAARLLRHDDRANLRHAVVLLQMLMRVGRDRADAIAGAHAKFHQCRGPTIATVSELRVSEPERAIDNGLARGIQLAGATGEIHRGERDFHGEPVT
jgi:hypothetical protein